MWEKAEFLRESFIYYYRIYLKAYVKKAGYINTLIMSIVIGIIAKWFE